jgi:hypothetical protein
MKQNDEATLVLLSEEHSGRDEMNLAGNPFALLQAASRNGQSQIIREWNRELSNGKIVTARWKVEGDQELGLPGPNEELLYLVLLQITRESADENGIWPQKVGFSRYDIVRRLGWPDNGKSYKLLRDCFVRLTSVTIVADHAFWDARLKNPYPTIIFHILEDARIADEPKGKSSQNNLPLSYFKWNETLYESFLAGNVRSLALEFTLSLETPISRRLFRILELLRHARKPALNEVRLDIFTLRDRLGMTAYAYASKIRQVITPAIDELISRGYLSSVEFQKAKKTETAIFTFSNVQRIDKEEEMGNTSTNPSEAPRTRQKPQQLALLEEEPPTGVRADALRCYELFLSLNESEQNELLEIARREVSPIWHDRVGQPESPMSLGLWQLVTERYSDRLK